MSEFIGIPRIDRLLDGADETVNRHGNRVRHLLLPGDRYLFDFNLSGEWDQFDTENDASYFGVWVNKSKLRLLSFVEGDLYLTLCADAAAYDAEISDRCSSYGRSPIYVAVSDDQITAGYQVRSQLFIDPARAPEAAGQETDDL